MCIRDRIMLYFSLWLTLLVLAGVILMIIISKKVGGGSAKYFIRQQATMGKAEGFIQEMMNGMKVVKVFCHEKKSAEDFDSINNELCNDSRSAHTYASMLGPIIMNIGNILYAVSYTHLRPYRCSTRHGKARTPGIRRSDSHNAKMCIRDRYNNTVLFMFWAVAGLASAAADIRLQEIKRSAAERSAAESNEKAADVTVLLGRE